MADRSLLAAAAACILAGAAPASPPVAGIDPLEARVDDSDARRFAAVWRSSGGRPTAAELQSAYLANPSRAVQVFTPNRIVRAERLAATIATSPSVYRDAVERCLPWVEGTNTQLRATYLGLRGLFHDKPLPRIAVVIGANNSGGTAKSGIQVIGLEVICRVSPTRGDFEEAMRQFFAHETVHTFQQGHTPAALKDPLLAAALAEGVPDYVTALVTARVPNASRDGWARPREAWIWAEFEKDAATVKAGTNANGDMTPAAQVAFRRWFGNAGEPPAGWPDELGYWVGMRVAESYVHRSADQHAAIDELIVAADPTGILEQSGYEASFRTPRVPRQVRKAP